MEKYSIWEQRKLGEIAKTLDYGLNASAKDFDGTHKYIRITDIDDDLHFFDESNLTSPDIDFSNADNYLLKRGDILFARTGASVGKTYLHDKDDDIVYFAGFLIRARFSGSHDTNFVYQNTFTKQYNTFIRVMSQRSGQPGVNAQEYASYSLGIPLFEEMQKIGSFFLNLDNIIAANQRKVEKLKRLKAAYLQQMFPRAGECVPRIRFKGFSGDWVKRTIGEYGYFYYGKSAPKWSVLDNATTPCVRYGELYTKFNEKISRIYSYTNMPSDQLKFSTGREVLVPRVGENPLDFAKCSWLSLPNIAIGEMISVYNTEQNPLFVAIYFNALLRKSFAEKVEGGSVSNLYYERLVDIPVCFPLLAEQEMISNFFESLNNQILLSCWKLEQLKKLKTAYLQKIFV